MSDSDPVEVIDVRPDERLDEARLHDFLRDQLPGADRPMSVRQFGGGHANLTYLLRFGEPDAADAVEYVLRRPPLGPVAPGAHDMKREYRALSRLWRGFPLAPRAFLFSDDPALIGADFFVMERRHGVVVRGAIPEIFGGGRDPVANRKLSEVIVDTLAELHAVDADEVGLGELGRPEGFMKRQVAGWADRYERAKTDDLPVADELAHWLEASLPESGPPSLLHNDWKLDNMAVDPADPGRCVAVYDWDMCTRGDGLCDLGTLMAYWRDPEETVEAVSGMPSRPGFLRRSEAIARYAERSARDLAAIDWYVVFGTFKTAVVLQQIYVRWVRGQTRDARFEGMGAGARALFDRAAALRP